MNLLLADVQVGQAREYHLNHLGGNSFRHTRSQLINIACLGPARVFLGQSDHIFKATDIHELKCNLHRTLIEHGTKELDQEGALVLRERTQIIDKLVTLAFVKDIDALKSDATSSRLVDSSVNIPASSIAKDFTELEVFFH